MASVKLNFTLDERVKDALFRLVPKGERSQVVNMALACEIKRRGRERTYQKLLKIREKVPPLSTREIVEQLASDRHRRGFLS